MKQYAFKNGEIVETPNGAFCYSETANKRIAELKAERDRLLKVVAIYKWYFDLGLSHISAEDQALLEEE